MPVSDTLIPPAATRTESLFATSRQNSVGTFAVVALMTGSMVDEYIPVEMLELPANSTELISIKTKYIYSVSLEVET